MWGVEMAAIKWLGREVYQEAFDRLGNISAVARDFGVCHRTVTRSLRGKQTDPTIQASMDAVGTGMVPAIAWIKTKGTKDSPGYSLMLKPAADDTDPLERIREAFTGLPAAPPAPAAALCG